MKPFLPLLALPLLPYVAVSGAALADNSGSDSSSSDAGSDNGSSGDNSGNSGNGSNSDDHDNTAGNNEEANPTGAWTSSIATETSDIGGNDATGNTSGNGHYSAAASVAGQGSSKELGVSAAYYAEALANLKRNPKKSGALFELGIEAAKRAIEMKALERRNLELLAKAKGEPLPALRTLTVADEVMRSKEVGKLTNEINKEFGLEEGDFVYAVIKNPLDPAKLEELKAGKIREGSITEALEKAAALEDEEKAKLTKLAAARKIKNPMRSTLLAKIRALSDYADTSAPATASGASDVSKYLPKRRMLSSQESGRAFDGLANDRGEFFSDLNGQEVTIFDVVKRKYRDSSTLQRLGLLRDLQVR